MASRLDQLLYAINRSDTESALQQHQEKLQRKSSGMPAVQHYNPAAQKAVDHECAQCGATKTPQWREGPLGPKTLCNACGVKWVRQQKGSRASTSRRTVNRTRSQPQEVLEKFDCQDADTDYRPTASFRTRDDRKGGRRRMTRAEDLRAEGCEARRDSNEDSAQPDQLERSMGSFSDSRDDATSLLHIDEAEEMNCNPKRRRLACGSKAVHSSHLYRDNSREQSDVQVARPPQPQPPDEMGFLKARERNVGTIEQNNIAVLASSAIQSALLRYPDFEQTQHIILQSLPLMDFKGQQQCQELNSQMESILCQSAAAEAAVNAVAQVLAFKQAEAAEARLRADQFLPVYIAHLQQRWAYRQQRGYNSEGDLSERKRGT